MAVIKEHENIKAFLDMIAYAEGTPKYGNQDGYNVLFGGETFNNEYVDHPRKAITRRMGSTSITSTAAGRYQFLTRTWDSIVKQYGFKGRFTPEAQDLAAIKLIQERKAYDDIKNGDFSKAVAKVRNIWASLPGAGYGQPEKKLKDLEKVYKEAGGWIKGEKPSMLSSAMTSLNPFNGKEDDTKA